MVHAELAAEHSQIFKKWGKGTVIRVKEWAWK